MEATGVALDLEALGVLDREFAAEISRLEGEIYADVGHEFKIGRPKQLEQVLFVELQPARRASETKTGYSTDASVLEELRRRPPGRSSKLLDWRIYTKLRSTYVEALPTLIAADGRLHTTFHQAVAATGPPVLVRPEPPEHPDPDRRSAGASGARSWPASPDTTLVAADYSQIELRILAHVSGDEHLRDAFAREADIHRETAARVLHKDPADVTPDERSMAKMVNFGIAYGMSDFGLSRRAGITPRRRRRSSSTATSRRTRGISYYMLHIKETAREQGYVTTLLGRKRQIPELRGAQPALRARRRADGDQHADPGHGRRHREDRDDPARPSGCGRGVVPRPGAALRSTTSCCSRSPRDEVDRLVPILRETMEGALPLDVPLTVDVKVGDDWEGMTPVSRADAIAAEADEAPERRSRRLSRPRRCPSCPRSRRSRATCATAAIVGADDHGRARRLAADPPRRRTRGVRRGVAGRRDRGGRPARPSSSSSTSTAAPSLTIHLKMTGQLFVVPADAAARTRTSASCSRSPTGASCASATSASSAGSACTARSGTASWREATTRRSTASGRSRWTRRSRCARSARASAGGARPPQAAPARPGVHRRRRQHLRRRGALAARLHPLRSAAIAAARRRATPVPRPSADPGRGRRAARRRRSTTTPRPTATARCRSTSHVYQRTGRAVSALRPADPPDRGRRRARTHFCSWCQRLPAADRTGAAAILRTMTGGPRRAGGRWTELGGRGDARADAGRGRRAAARGRTERTKRAAATRRAAARAVRRPRRASVRSDAILRRRASAARSARS